MSPKKPLINTIRDWLPTAKRGKVLRDTKRVTGWVYAASNASVRSRALDNVANRSNRQRQELFGQTAANRGFHPAIAEKDFWVCWVLMKLFASNRL